MSLDTTKKQVTEHLAAFRETGEINELNSASNLIECIEVHGLPVYEERQAARTAKLELWLMLFDAIDSAKDPEFDPEDVPSSRVMVPPDTPMKPGWLVVSPEGIADPADRKKYDEAVAANAAKTKKYSFQKQLRQLDAQLTTRADKCIGTITLRSPHYLKEMSAAINEHVHNAERSAHLRSLVTPQDIMVDYR